MSEGTPPVKVGSTIAGKYLIDRVLGTGGVGVVMAATHLTLDQQVAIKFLLPEGVKDGEVAERFANEARVSARLKSEHVARILDVDRLPDGTPFMVMEYLEGEDLASLLLKRSRLPYTEACTLVMQACEALAEAHAKGIIHRDLKPANLFLARTPGGGEMIKLLDFGISKTHAHGGGNHSLTKTSAVLGSPTYMPPEQMTSSSTVDARADLWALGIVLYELVTGAAPFEGDSLPALVASILQQTPKPMSAHGVRVPPEFEGLVLRCLEKNPATRMASVGDLALGLAIFAPHGSGVSLDRISRLEATNPSMQNIAARRSHASLPGLALPRLTLLRQSEAPGPMPPEPDLAPALAPARAAALPGGNPATTSVRMAVKAGAPAAPFVSARETLKSMDWEADPAPAPWKKVVVLGLVATAVVIGALTLARQPGTNRRPIQPAPSDPSR